MALPRTVGSAGEEVASRRAITAACVGNAAEWYDFAIYGALATVIGVVYFPADNPAAALSAAFAAYGTALLRAAARCPRLRPDGRRSRAAQRLDRGDPPDGRCHLAGGVPARLRHDRCARPDRPLLLRAIQGLAAGGELGVAAVFILEHAPRSGRGRVGAWHTATMGSGIAAGMAVVAVLSYLFAGTGQDSGWWRIAFLIAIPLGVIGLLLRRRITDTTQFVTLRADSGLIDRPVQELWRHHRPSLVRGFCLLAAGSLAFNTFFIFMPNHLIARHGAALTPTLLVTALSLGIAAIAALALGRLSDRIGRRPVVIVSAAALAGARSAAGSLGHPGICSRSLRRRGRHRDCRGRRALDCDGRRALRRAAAFDRIRVVGRPGDRTDRWHRSLGRPAARHRRRRRGGPGLYVPWWLSSP